MAVTLQQIADKAGVSRGTVDRALKERGRINPEVAAKIRKIADEMGYQPNRAGRALAMAKHSIKIGIIIQSMETPFMQGVLEGAKDAKQEVERLGATVTIKKISELDSDKVIAAMHKMKGAGYNGIGLVASDEEKLADTIDQFTEEGISVVTFNSDAAGTKRMCFIGQNAGQSGRTAAGLMAEILPDNAVVQVISGYASNQSHKERAEGFINELNHCRPDVKLLGIRYAYDNDRAAAEITQEVLKEHKELNGIYLAASGAKGVCQVIGEKGLKGSVKVISNDITDSNIESLKNGTIQFILGQDAYSQGYRPVMVLFDKLFDGKDPEEEYQYTEIVIKTKYNI